MIRAVAKRIGQCLFQLRAHADADVRHLHFGLPAFQQVYGEQHAVLSRVGAQQRDYRVQKLDVGLAVMGLSEMDNQFAWPGAPPAIALSGV